MGDDDRSITRSAKFLAAPPELVPDKYMMWKKKMAIWEMATTVVEEKRAPTVFLSLTGKAMEAILEINPKELNSKEGMEKLYEKLDTLFAVDTAQAALSAYGSFEKFVRPASMSISDFNVEFDRMVQQLREHDIKLPEVVLAYRALKSADLGEENEKLVVATVRELTLKEMMLQIRKIMGIRPGMLVHSSTASVSVVKTEPLEVQHWESTEKEHQNPSDTLYSSGSQSNHRGNRGRYRGAFGGYGGSSKGRGNNRGSVGRGKFAAKNLKQNPLGRDGKPSKCAVCGSIMHWVKNCPHADDAENDGDDSVFEANIVLMSQQGPAGGGPTLLGETLGSMVLDSGCPRSVCGKTWYDCYLDALPEKFKKNLELQESEASFRFGNGETLKSLFKVSLPCRLAGNDVKIVTDVVNSEIPLLLSKNAMKKSSVKLDFGKDSLFMFGKKLRLHCTTSGHYFVPLGRPGGGSDTSVVLFSTSHIEQKSEKEKKQVALKLHKQFSHPSEGKLMSLVTNSGIKDRVFLKSIEEVSENCDLCQRYKRTPSRPVVGFPLASRFNEVVSMDLKDIAGVKIIHLIDNFSRYSAALRVNSKDSEEVINAIFKVWIAYFGAPEQFLSDNGGEFDNEKFRDSAQNLNIIVKTTPAQSPWSNGICERHNAVINDMVVKTMEETKCRFDLALSWSLSSKNALHNVCGFSPNQLVFGYNPSLPTVLINRAPALEKVSCSEVVAENLNALHAARNAFIQCEASEKIARALRHQIRPGLARTYSNGDIVFYKRNQSARWLGPGTVIGSENKQVLVKHGGTYVRVHPCRLQLFNKHSVEDLGGVSQGDVCSEEVTPPRPDMEHYKSSPQDKFLDDIEEEIDWEGSCGASGQSSQLIPQNIPADDSEIPQNVPVNDNENRRKPGRPPKTVEKVVVTRVNLPKIGQEILCKLKSSVDEDWQKLSVVSRAGKATGKNKYCFNVLKPGEEPFWLDFEKSVEQWKDSGDALEEEGAVSSRSIEIEDDNFQDCLVVSEEDYSEAKNKELRSWSENNVYEEVKYQNQDCITTTWVCTMKHDKDGPVPKARLVARGFQDKDVDLVRSDSPTCSKESLRVLLVVAASSSWQLNSMDIKTAFLQGRKFERDVFIFPPKEAEVSLSIVWKLKKCVYGLSDASREWYLTVREELMKSGMRPSKYDQALFTWHSGQKICGIMSTHVDDFCWAGTPSFERKVIAEIKKVFVIKTEEYSCFKYLGLDIQQSRNKEIVVKQEEYVKSIAMITGPSGYTDDTTLCENDLKQCRSIIGKLNWLATQTRPDLSYEVSALTSALKEKKVGSISAINKVTRKAKKSPSKLLAPNLGDLQKLKIVCYCDASFGSLESCGSQGGYVVFLEGSNGNHMPISWQSNRIKRVVKSTHAAETLAMVDAMEASIYYQSYLLDLLGLPDDLNLIPIHCKTDNKALFQSVMTTTQILDKRLRIETAIIREVLERKEIAKLDWIPTDVQLSDGLTKSGVPSDKLLGHLHEPMKPLP